MNGDQSSRAAWLQPRKKASSWRCHDKPWNHQSLGERRRTEINYTTSQNGKNSLLSKNGSKIKLNEACRRAVPFSFIEKILKSHWRERGGGLTNQTTRLVIICGAHVPMASEPHKGEPRLQQILSVSFFLCFMFQLFGKRKRFKSVSRWKADFDLQSFN